MEGRPGDGALGSNASTSDTLGVSETDAYPDPAIYNLTDRHDQQLFMQRYQAAQQHDPQMKIAILVFYLIIVRPLPQKTFLKCLFCAKTIDLFINNAIYGSCALHSSP